MNVRATRAELAAAADPAVVRDGGSWRDWLLSSIQSGLVVLDAAGRVVWVNAWFASRVRSGTPGTGQTLQAWIPELVGSRLVQVVDTALRRGFPGMLSHSLHPSPLPLFASADDAAAGLRIRQDVQVIPMGKQDAERAGQRYVMIHVSDVSVAVTREKRLRAQAGQMHAMAHVDGLTGIANRRTFDEQLAIEWRVAQRAGTSLAVVLLDIDYFKSFNDAHGHQAGDQCLVRVAQAVRAVVSRPRDLAARYGGEELVLVLPQTSLESALFLAERAREAVAALAIEHRGLEPGRVVTLSAGVAAVVPSADVPAADLVSMADRALYRAKGSGRARCCALDAQTGSFYSPADALPR